jgi:hypothetical protein
MLSLKAQGGQIYVLPPSERGAARLLEVLSDWRQGRDVEQTWRRGPLEQLGGIARMLVVGRTTLLRRISGGAKKNSEHREVS